MKKWVKILIAVLAVVVIAFLGISVFLGFTMTKTSRLPVEGNPGQWGLGYSDVSFPSAEDEITLRGWYMPAAGSEQIIIVVHGAGGNRADTSIGIPDIIAGLADHGYSVLAFDLRGHGESDGNRISAGYYEVRDLDGAVEYVKTLGYGDIGVLGFSMGAVTSVIAAGENTDIDAVVADSSIADLNDIIGPEFKMRS
jgi:pimeloyl-ACP methyl ester carboxylesterase